MVWLVIVVIPPSLLCSKSCVACPAQDLALLQSAYMPDRLPSFLAARLPTGWLDLT